MTTYYVAVNQENGTLMDGFAYSDENRPLPPEFTYKSFSDTDSDYELLYALFVHDENRITTTLPNIYIHPQMGGVTYDLANNKFICAKEDISINLDLLRQMRNQALASTDAITLAPDLPANMMEDILAYRQALRDMTSNVESGTWTNIYDIVWPPYPTSLTPKVE